MTKPKAKKVVVPARLTSDGVKLLSLLAEKKGIGKSAMLEILIRERADSESIFIEDHPDENQA